MQQNQNIIIKKHELKINKYETTTIENDKKINSFIDKLKDNETQKMDMVKDFQESIKKYEEKINTKDNELNQLYAKYEVIENEIIDLDNTHNHKINELSDTIEKQMDKIVELRHTIFLNDQKYNSNYKDKEHYIENLKNLNNETEKIKNDYSHELRVKNLQISSLEEKIYIKQEELNELEIQKNKSENDLIKDFDKYKQENFSKLNAYKDQINSKIDEINEKQNKITNLYEKIQLSEETVDSLTIEIKKIKFNNEIKLKEYESIMDNCNLDAINK